MVRRIQVRGRSLGPPIILSLIGHHCGIVGMFSLALLRGIAPDSPPQFLPFLRSDPPLLLFRVIFWTEGTTIHRCFFRQGISPLEYIRISLRYLHLPCHLLILLEIALAILFYMRRMARRPEGTIAPPVPFSSHRNARKVTGVKPGRCCLRAASSCVLGRCVTFFM